MTEIKLPVRYEHGDLCDDLFDADDNQIADLYIHPDYIAKCINEHTALTAERDRLKANYYELILAVSSKAEGESRHETALRYIRQAEEPSDQTGQAALKGETE